MKKRRRFHTDGSAAAAMYEFLFPVFFLYLEYHSEHRREYPRAPYNYDLHNMTSRNVFCDRIIHTMRGR